MTSLTVRCRFTPSPKPAPGRAVKKAVSPARRAAGPSRIARMLALVHHLDGLIEQGTLTDYAHAARALGVTRARVSQITSLLLLAPEIQAHIAVGGLVLTERALRRVVKEPDWAEQHTLVEQKGIE